MLPASQALSQLWSSLLFLLIIILFFHLLHSHGEYHCSQTDLFLVANGPQICRFKAKQLSENFRGAQNHRIKRRLPHFTAERMKSGKVKGTRPYTHVALCGMARAQTQGPDIQPELSDSRQWQLCSLAHQIELGRWHTQKEAPWI